MNNTGENHPDVVPKNRFIDTVEDMTDSEIVTWFTENPPSSDELSITLAVDTDVVDSISKPAVRITRTPTPDFVVECVVLDSYDLERLESKVESQPSDTTVETCSTVNSAVNVATDFILSYQKNEEDFTVDTREEVIDRELISFTTVSEGVKSHGNLARKRVLRKISGTEVWEFASVWDTSTSSGFELHDVGYLNYEGLKITGSRKDRIVNMVRKHIKERVEDSNSEVEDFLELREGKFEIPNTEEHRDTADIVAHKIETIVPDIAEDIANTNEEITNRSINSGEDIHYINQDPLIAAKQVDEENLADPRFPPHGKSIIDAVEKNIGSLPFQYPFDYESQTVPDDIAELVYGLFKLEIEAMNEELGLPPESFPVEITFSADDRTQRAVELAVQTSLPWKAANVAALKEQVKKNDAVTLSNKDVADMLGISASTVSRHCDTIERVIKQSEWTVNNLTIDSC